MWLKQKLETHVHGFSFICSSLFRLLCFCVLFIVIFYVLNFVFNKIYFYLYVYSVRTVKSSLVIDDLNSICNCAAYFMSVFFVLVFFFC